MIYLLYIKTFKLNFLTVNVAREKPTAESNDFLYQSGFAVDGKTDLDVHEAFTCTSYPHAADDDPWWRVDLISCYVVTRVIIHQMQWRYYRLGNFEIRIGMYHL